LSPGRLSIPRNPGTYWPQANPPPRTAPANTRTTPNRRPTRVFQKMHMRHTPPAHPLSIIPTCQKNMCQQRSAVTPGFPDDGLAATNGDIAPPFGGCKPFLAENPRGRPCPSRHPSRRAGHVRKTAGNARQYCDRGHAAP